MSPAIATFIVVSGILGLFWLDRDSKVRTSLALWIPTVWFGISCTRSVSQWLGDSARIASVDQVMDGSPTDRLVYMSLLALGIIVLLSRMTQVSRVLRANTLITFCLLYFAVTLLWSDYPMVAFKRWNKAVADFIMVLIVLTDREPLAATKRLLARLGFVLIPLSILFIKYYPHLGRAYSDWTGAAIYTGVTTNKNTLGVVCLCLGIGAAWRVLAAYQRQEANGRCRHFIAHAVILAMALYLFKLMDSMTSLSAFLIGIVLLLMTSFRAILRRPVIVHFAIVSMLAVSSAVAFLGASPDTLRAMGRNPTLTDRTMLWKDLLGVVQNPWFGTGFESFWLGSRLNDIWRMNPSFRPNEAHNGYLEVFLNLGWVGVALLAALVVTRYPKVFNALRKGDPRGKLNLAYFVVGLVYNFTEAAFFKIEAVAWLFFLLAIVTVPAFPSTQTRTVAAEDDTSLRRLPGEAERASNEEVVWASQCT